MSRSDEPAPAVLHRETLAALLLAAAQAPLGSTMIAVALPSLSRDLETDLSLATGLLVTSYLIVSIVAQSPGGKLGDVFGHARTVRAGMALQVLGTLAGLVAQGLHLLVFARVAMALGGALVIPATMALLRLHVPDERRTQTFGLVGSTMGLSAALGPSLGGELVTLLGWRALFIAPLPFLALSVALVVRHPVPSASQPVARGALRGFDWVGTALLAFAMTTLVVGAKAAGPMKGAALATSAGGMALFAWWELRAESPVLDPALFRIRTFTVGALVVCLQNFAMYGLVFQIPRYFQESRGATSRAVGHVMLAMMLAMFATSPLGGRLSDRTSPRTAALIGSGVSLVGFFLLHDLPRFATPPEAVPALLLLGLGLGIGSAPSQAAAMASVPGTRSGMAAGALATVRYAGGVASILALGVLLGPGGDATSGAHLSAVQVATAAAVLAALCCLFLPGRAAPR